MAPLQFLCAVAIRRALGGGISRVDGASLPPAPHRRCPLCAVAVASILTHATAIALCASLLCLICYVYVYAHACVYGVCVRVSLLICMCVGACAHVCLDLGLRAREQGVHNGLCVCLSSLPALPRLWHLIIGRRGTSSPPSPQSWTCRSTLSSISHMGNDFPCMCHVRPRLRGAMHG